MAYDWTMKKDDLLPALRVTLKGADNLPIDLTGASSVQFHMREAGGATLKIDAAAAFVLPLTSGIVEYTWTGTDTDTEGEYEGEFEVTFATGTMTFPNYRHMTIQIYEEIG